MLQIIQIFSAVRSFFEEMPVAFSAFYFCAMWVLVILHFFNQRKVARLKRGLKASFDDALHQYNETWESAWLEYAFKIMCRLEWQEKRYALNELLDLATIGGDFLTPHYLSKYCDEKELRFVLKPYLENYQKMGLRPIDYMRANLARSNLFKLACFANGRRDLKGLNAELSKDDDISLLKNVVVVDKAATTVQAGVTKLRE